MMHRPTSCRNALTLRSPRRSRASRRLGRRSKLSRGRHREYFGRRAVGFKRGLRELFRRGRISLVISLGFLAASIAIGDAVAS